MSKPKVSVIIAAYNAMRFLPTTLDSVFRQTFSDYEVIIVNDGSSDDIEQWIAGVTHSGVKFVSQNNQGLSAARNTGLNYAEGQYIAFLDADDLWDPTKLEKQVRVLDENSDVGLVYNWVDSIDENGNIQWSIRKNSVEGNVWQKLIEHNLIECGSVPMIRYSCFEAVGVFDKKIDYAQGWDMWLRIAAYYPFKVIKEPLTYYRSHPHNKSKNWEPVELNHKIIIEKAFKSAPDNLKHLKNKSYGFAYLILAWKILQSFGKVHPKVLYFQRQAIQHSPQVIFSRQNIRLSAAIILVSLLKFHGYSKFRSIVRLLIRKIVSFSKVFASITS